MVTKNPAFVADSVSLIEVRIVEGRVESHEEFESSRIKAFDPDCALKIFLDPKENLVRGDLKVWVDTESEPAQPEAHGHFHFNFYFFVADLQQWLQQAQDGATFMEPSLQNAIASVSYSTARGILISRFQGTAFSRFILPVINPNDLLERSTKPKKTPSKRNS